MSGDNLELIELCRLELNNMKALISPDPFDSVVKYLVSYAVIRSCGTIEVIYKDIIYNHLIKGANKEAVSYFSRHIKDSSSNPSTGKISSLLVQINPEWKNTFESKIKNSIDKGQLNSLVDLRNELAHGGSITSSIDNVIKYFESGCNILNILDSIVK